MEINYGNHHGLVQQWIVLSTIFIYKCNTFIIYCSSRNFWTSINNFTFRTPSEAVAIANNTPYGLAASIWSENINLALDIAPKIKAGVIWINSTNLLMLHVVLVVTKKVVLEEKVVQKE